MFCLRVITVIDKLDSAVYGYTFSGPADYIGGTFTAQFGTEAGARFCQNIQTVLDTDVEPGNENFLVNIVIIPGSPLRPGTPDTATVFITGMNDSHTLCPVQRILPLPSHYALLVYHITFLWVEL